MNLHPRTMKVQAAEIAISTAVTDALDRLHDEDLTYAELIGIMNQIQARWIKYAVRSERHPDDPEKRGDEA